MYKPFMLVMFLLKWLVILAGVNVIRSANAAVSDYAWASIRRVNQEGPYLGILVPNSFEMSPLLQSPSFVPQNKLPHIDVAGRRFRIGKVENKRVILVMTGLSMSQNNNFEGISTELLLSLFKIKGILHIGVAENANPQLQIGDVIIPQYWAHTGLWNWQRYGDGPEDKLYLESSGDYTRSIGYLKISDFNSNVKDNNLLNNVWYQPEEVFPVDGYPEIRQHAFWIPVNELYFSLAEKLEGIELEGCLNSTCLPRRPLVTRVERGISANVFIDNAAYREFVHTKFNATAIDMESAAIALVCLQQRTPFLTIRALSDLAGGGSSISNGAAIFAPMAAHNAVVVLLKFISLLNP